MSDLNELFEDPSAKVEHFRSTYQALRSSPDVEPPRGLMFEFDRPARAAWFWRWVAPMVASAAVAFAVVTFTPRPQAPPQVIRVVQQVPIPAQQVDFQRIIDQLRDEQTKEVQRVQGRMAVLEWNQRMVERNNIENASSIQQLAALQVKR